MKVCVKVIPHDLSLGIQRVGQALARYAPDWATVVDNPNEADVWVLHVIGHGSMRGIEGFHGDIAMIQYCLTTTEDPTPTAWLPHWERARVVWSYYDLKDFLRSNGALVWKRFNFMHAPLGVDGAVFKPAMPLRKLFAVGTSGYIAETEGVKECIQAATNVGRRNFHLGPVLNVGKGAPVTFAKGLTDREVANFWSQCSYVAGMRRIEGFELPALEGLACGARPICFDAPHYRQWFAEHAEYVTEGDFDEVVEQVTHILSRPTRVVTAAERAEVLRKFNWKELAEQFWEALR